MSDRYSHATPCHTETSVLVRCESDVRYNPSGKYMYCMIINIVLLYGTHCLHV